MNRRKPYLSHYGVKGMKWGVVKQEETLGSRFKSFLFGPNHSVSEKNSEILKKNPHAAVVNHDAIREERNRRLKNIAIGVGLGVAVAGAAVLYLKHKDLVDSTIDKVLKESGLKSLSDEDLSKITSEHEQIGMLKKMGLDVNSKQDLVTNNWVASWIGHDKHRYDPISHDAYSKLETTGVSLNPGHIIKRITNNPGEVVRDNAFISINEDDHNRYAAFLPGMWKANSGIKVPSHQITMEALEKITSPSKKERVDILVDLIKKDPEVFNRLKSTGETRSAEKAALDIALKRYNSVATGLMDRNSNISKKYISEVSRRGYNALVDDNDAGRLTRQPLILLKSKAIKQLSTKPLSYSDRQKALSSIVPMDNETFSNTYKVIKGKDKVQLASFVVNLYSEAMKK